MKRIIYIYSLLMIAGSALISCKKYLDINDNPNNAVTADPKLLFSYATTAYASNRAGGDLYLPMVLAGQSISSGGTSTEQTSWAVGFDAQDRYNFDPNNDIGVWQQFYTSVGYNLKNAISLCENPTGGFPKNMNGAAQAKVLLAEVFYELTTTFGDIPFTQALNDNFSQPLFDSQKVVMQGAINMIDQALEQFDSENPLKFSAEYDMMYQGDIAKWIKAARSLKLRMLMTMVDREPSKAAEIGQMITAGDFISSADENMFVPFQNISGKKNPKYFLKEAIFGGEPDLFFASTYLVNFMNLNNDPRLAFYFTKGTSNSAYLGIEPGADADEATHSKINNNLHYPEQPELIFTYSEQLFYEAEIYARGLGVAVDLTVADQKYKEAIRQSAIFFGVSNGDAADYVAGLPALTAVSDPLYYIHYEHWIDKMDRGIDCFTQWRRSGSEGNEVPDLQVPSNAPAGMLFRRYDYPASAEVAANANAPASPGYRVNTWFDL